MSKFIHTKISEYIKEDVNDNYIYTWISTNKINDLVNHNKIYANFKHNIKDVDYYGNSFSRNKFLELDIYSVRLTVDKNLLNNNYKIIPLDGEIIHRKIDINDYYKYNKYRDRNPKKTNIFGDQPINKNFHKHRFGEEFVIGDIKNVSRYIKKIDIYKENWNSEKIDEVLLKKLKEYAEKHNIILKNNF